MGDHLQEHGPALATVTAGRQGLAQSTLDHTHDRFDLPTLAVATQLTRTREVPTHHPAIVTARRLGGRSTDLRRNDRSDMQFVPQEQMHPLAVLPRVGQQRIDRSTPHGSAHHVEHVRMIRTRTTPRDGRQNQMAGAVADQAHLRESSIRRRLLGLKAFRTSSHEVATGVVTFEATAVDGRELQALLEDLRVGGRDKRLIKEAIRGVFFRSRSAAFWSVV